ncbi:MAG TPA: response regulator transcription factor [Chitinophagaceae bacterium]|nr:response regulator transcription factor [Chitinophagaceae bacterium]
MKLLIVEDEIPLSQSIADYLSPGYICEQAFTYATALDKIKEYDYDCIILDIMLPGGSGMQLLNFLKKMRKAEAVIIISAKNSIDDRVTGLESGADDYLTKPFHLSELNARVAALLRRKSFGGHAELIAGDILVDIAGKVVKVNNTFISLTVKEYQLLLYFIANRNKVLSKNNIASHLWDDSIDSFGNYDFIYTHIKNLRKKIVAAGGEDCIRSIYGVGYKMQVG